MNITFLGIGAQKAGTSTLHDILRQHSDIYLPESKEAHFFDLSERYEKGINWLKETHFATYNNQHAVGKFTPEYLFMNEAPQRIFDAFGTNIKFLVVFRHPVDRAVSHYNMIYRRGLEKLDFCSAVEQEDDRIRGSEWDRIHYSYMNRGLYSKQLQKYLELFPEENFLYLVFEKDIINQMPQTIIRIQHFLEVDHEQLNVNLKSNEAYEPYSIKLNAFIRKDNLAKKVSKKLLSSSVRYKLKNMFLSKLNKKSKSKSNMFALTPIQRESYYNDFFFKDTKQLESMIKINLNGIWYNE